MSINKIPTTSNGYNKRHECHLKYSKHGTFSWDKWSECYCVFSLSADLDGIVDSHLELHSNKNVHDPSGKIINLEGLHSLAITHGNAEKNEPENIIILKFDNKKYRLGFSNTSDYRQWKSLLNEVYDSQSNLVTRVDSDENRIINMIYESVNAQRYSVSFVDQSTRESLNFYNNRCLLTVDSDKLVLEENNYKHIILHSAIHSICYLSDFDLEFELGSSAPVKGSLRIRFESSSDARSCYSKIHDKFLVSAPSVPTRQPRRSLHVKNNSRSNVVNSTCSHLSGSRINTTIHSSNKNQLTLVDPYYNVQSPTSQANGEYTSFATLV